MLILASATDQIQIVTAAAGAIYVHASYLDNVSGSVAPGRQNTSITTAATTTVVSPPASGVFRNLKTLHCYNGGGAGQAITVLHTDGTTTVQLHQVTLAAGATLQYIDEVGFLITAKPMLGQQVLINTYTVTAAITEYHVLSIDGTYDDYELHIIGYQTSSVSQGLFMRVSNTAGSTFQSDSSYAWEMTASIVGASAPALQSSGADNKINVMYPSAASAQWINNARLLFAKPSGIGAVKPFRIDTVQETTTPGTLGHISGAGHYYGNYNVVNGLQLFISDPGVNIQSGTFNLYGIAK